MVVTMVGLISQNCQQWQSPANSWLDEDLKLRGKTMNKGYKASVASDWTTPIGSPMCSSPKEAQMWLFGHYPNKRSCEITGFIQNDNGDYNYSPIGCPVYKKVTKKTKFEQVQESAWPRFIRG